MRHQSAFASLCSLSRPTALPLALAALLLAAPASALTVLENETLVIDTAVVEDYELRQSSTLTVLSAGSVTGDVSAPGVSGGSVQILGGTVTGQVNLGPLSAITMTNGSSINGSLFTFFQGGGDIQISGGEIRGSAGVSAWSLLDTFEPPTLRTPITGALFQGGDSATDGGHGISVIDSTINIGGGFIYGGDGGETGGDALQTRSAITPGCFCDITGGDFRGGGGGTEGGSALSLPGYGNVDIFGGTFNAGEGGVLDGWLIELDLRAEEGPAINRVTLTGGEFGSDNVGRGFFVGGVLDVFGTDLALDGGFLTGTLLDGSPIHVPVEIGSNEFGTGQVNLYEGMVPEPAAPLLVGLALAGLVRTRADRALLGT